MKRFIGRVGRFVKGLARDENIPRWAKVLLGFAALPIPGPVDEGAGLIVASFLLLRRRDVVARHWRESAGLNAPEAPEPFGS
ncbi:MAG: hypothetical protein E6F95_03150 [Actinobacteria bacterium]|nr:MAG: hypothetical protein E6F95_03150 [Actinomycetota bacterium]